MWGKWGAEPWPPQAPGRHRAGIPRASQSTQRMWGNTCAQCLLTAHSGTSRCLCGSRTAHAGAARECAHAQCLIPATSSSMDADAGVSGSSPECTGPRGMYTEPTPHHQHDMEVSCSGPGRPLELTGKQVRGHRELSWCQFSNYLEYTPDPPLAHNPPTNNTEPTGVHLGSPQIAPQCCAHQTMP